MKAKRVNIIQLLLYLTMNSANMATQVIYKRNRLRMNETQNYQNPTWVMSRWFGVTGKMLKQHRVKAEVNLSNKVMRHLKQRLSRIYHFNMRDYDDWISDSGDGNLIEDW